MKSTLYWEAKRHGTADFPVAYYRISNTHPQYIMPLMLGQRQVERRLTDKHESLIHTTNLLFTSLRDRPPCYTLAAHSLLCELVYRLHVYNCVYAPHGEQDDHRRIMIAELLEWIDCNYAKKITLQILAQIAAVHEKHLCRVFKEFTGQTPIDYVNQVRMEYASAALLRSSRSITEIALDCGFSDAGYFSRQFHRVKGMTPRAFRASHGN